MRIHAVIIIKAAAAPGHCSRHSHLLFLLLHILQPTSQLLILLLLVILAPANTDHRSRVVRGPGTRTAATTVDNKWPTIPTPGTLIWHVAATRTVLARFTVHWGGGGEMLAKSARRCQNLLFGISTSSTTRPNTSVSFGTAVYPLQSQKWINNVLNNWEKKTVHLISFTGCLLQNPDFMEIFYEGNGWKFEESFLKRCRQWQVWM